MSDETEVIPLRPGFDNEFRGFNRNQVIEHIEMLEDQIKMLTLDRDEAARLNEDQRRITDHTRRQLEEATAALERMQNSDTGLPHATHRMQNMLMMADEEARSIRDHARREADTIRGTAHTDAAQIRSEAEAMANALRDECGELVKDLQQQREKLDAQQASLSSKLAAERRTLERSVKEAYDQAMANAEHKASEMLRQAKQRCEEMDAASLRYHEQIVEDLNKRTSELELIRLTMLESLESVAQFADSSRASLTALPRPSSARSGDQPGAGEDSRPGSPADQWANPSNRVSGELNIPTQADSEHNPDVLPHPTGQPSPAGRDADSAATSAASASANGFDAAGPAEEGN